MWRPAQVVRPIAIGVVRRDVEILVMKALGDHGETKGWRPPGGTIEFGERADAALEREFAEKLEQEVRCLSQICVLESLYKHGGVRGHEIVFVFEAAFINMTAYCLERFEFVDGDIQNEVSWVNIAEFSSGATPLFPEGLLQHVR